MSLFIKPLAIAFLSTAFLTHNPAGKDVKVSANHFIQKKDKPKIQAAILLDVSNSMDGLIDQAKAQLWNMVSVMGKAKCDEGAHK